MLKWNTFGRKVITKEEKKLRKVLTKLSRYAGRHGIDYIDLYILSDKTSKTLNLRAKKGEVEVANSYALIWTKKELKALLVPEGLGMSKDK